MTIKEFFAKLKNAGTTPEEWLEMLGELLEISGLDMDILLRVAKALHDPEPSARTESQIYDEVS